MAANVYKFLAPAPSVKIVTRGLTYTADTSGVITVNTAAAGYAFDIQDLMNSGCLSLGFSQAASNLSATTDPLLTSDNTLDYGPGSRWLNTSTGRVWECASSATGAAVWQQLSPAPAQFRNLLHGGDFTTNPWQRNIGGLAANNTISSAITSTPTYFADRWFGVGGASSQIQISNVATTSVAGFTQGLQFQRQSGNANTAAIQLGQALETNASVRLQGQAVVLSFWANAGANFSAANSTMTSTIYSGTGTNQNATLLAGNNWTGSVVVAAANQTLSSNATRFQVTGTVPANSTQLGVVFSYTPVGTAGTNDYILFQGVQLEVGSSASPFEHRDPEIELSLCQRYALVIAEPAANAVVASGGCAVAANTQLFNVTLPVTMRAAPTVTVSAGTFKTCPGGANANSSGFNYSGNQTVSNVVLTSTNTQAAGGYATLQGGGGNGYVVISADL